MNSTKKNILPIYRLLNILFAKVLLYCSAQIKKMKQLFTLLLISVLFCQCKKEYSNEYGIDPAFGFVNLNFQASVGDENLSMGKTYFNHVSEPFEVKRFQFYVHNVRLLSEDKNWVEVYPKEHFLVDFNKPASNSLSFYTFIGQFNAVEFTIGVDSARNFSGLQSGALDPLNGMFWAWSSGYVYAKLEGFSPLSRHPSGEFTYHIGGFREPFVAFRKIRIDFAPTDKLVLKKGDRRNIIINSDILKWFQSAHSLTIAQYYAIHAPGDIAAKFADNYEHMFSLKAIR